MHHRNEYLLQPLVFRTLGGQTIAVRQALAADSLLLAKLLGRLSDHTLHLRYMRSGYFPRRRSRANENTAFRMTAARTAIVE